LSVIGIVHEERTIDVWETAIIDVLLDEVVHALVQVLVGLVDFHIVCGECVGEVELDEDVVCIRWDGKEVLLLLAGFFVSYGGGRGDGRVLRLHAPPLSEKRS
jgi:hypothetical protein